MGTKTFLTLAIASAATGIGLCEGMTFSQVQEIAEHALGFPVWTHELGDKMMMDRLSDALRAQFPGLPTPDAAHADWRAAAEAALAAYGKHVEVAQGTQQRSEGPISSLVRMTGRPEDIAVIVDGRKL